ncbi:unnamed protein product [Prunus armeniaca]
MPHVFQGLLNRVVRGMRLRLTNGPLRPARIAAQIEVVSPRPARIELTKQEWGHSLGVGHAHGSARIPK